ncbi:unnamed protein product [Miscanthus lutarioriparius]|uniref:DUF642 domain-containing protein n=1 Tax=Miscanthus lutarioriparius TaxID=422564 RepID=A0A811QRJ0_9POAL|nr:unnamed protein product [Miscanthus lutarioriparius]
MAGSGSSRRGVLLFLLVGVAAAGVASAIPDGLLPNGNFEQGPDKSHMNGTRVIGQNSIPCWETSGFVEYIEPGQRQNDMRGAHLRPQAEQLNVPVAPESGDLPIQTVYTSSGWDSYSYAFKARHTTAWLTIHNPGAEEDPACGPIIDSVAIKAHHPPTRAKDNMLKNGDFEEGPYMFPDSPWGVLVPPMDEDDVSPLPGWMVMSDTKAVKYLDAWREVRTKPGRSYKLSFSVGDAANGCATTLLVDAYAALGRLPVSYESHGRGGSVRNELEFSAVANLTRVVFQSMGHYVKPDGTLCGPVVNDISLVSLPKHAARRLLM